MKITYPIRQYITRFLALALWLIAPLGGVTSAQVAGTPQRDDARFWQLMGEDYRLGTAPVIGRKTWGAEPPIPDGRYWEPYPAPLCRSLRRITIHHTHSTYSIRSLQQFHQTMADAKADIAYHYFIDADGKVYEARPLGFIGSHSESDNTFNVGIVLNGDFQTHPPTLAQQAALNQLLKGLIALCPGSYEEGLWTHRDRKQRNFPQQSDKQTICPGDHLARLTQRLAKHYALKMR
jgi:hypothetical protein